MFSYLRSWWNAPAGGGEVLRLALPLVISTSSWTLMYFIDRVFLGWYHPEALAASLPAGMVSFLIICFFLGVASYVNTFVSQYHGANHPERIGLAVWQGLRVGLMTLPVAALAIPLAPWLFGMVGHSASVQALEVRYFQLIALGLCAMVFSQALSSFFTGRGRVRTVMFVDLAAAAVNISLDYCWIFGKAGFPAWGMDGAAYATVVAHWFQAGAFFVLFLLPRNRDTFGTWSGRRADRELFGRLWRFGAPAGLQMLLDVSGFTIFVMFLGRIGPTELTVTNLVFNINNLAFIPMLGMGIATTTLVGQRLGENRPDLAARATWSAFTLAALYVSCIGAAYVFAPNLLLAIHGMKMDATQYETLRETSATLLRFVAVYCLFDMMIIVFVGALKGAGDTRFILYTSLAAAIAMATAAWVVVEGLNGGIYAGWYVLTSVIVGLGTTYMVRFLQGKWRDMRVIEAEYLIDPPLVASSSPLADDRASATPHDQQPPAVGHALDDLSRGA